MKRVAAVVPGYASTARVGEVLHLAPRSVRDLIYTGRLPSLRIGRLHYVRAADLDAERRRRLGLPLRHSRARSSQSAGGQPGARPRSLSPRPPTDPALRRQRAAERSELVERWAARHPTHDPVLPFSIDAAPVAPECAACGRHLSGRALRTADGASLCHACGRRALLDWADQRRLEVEAARRLSRELGAARQPQLRVA